MMTVQPAYAAARRIAAGNLFITQDVRREREAELGRLHGQERLLALYDLASDDYVASDGEAALRSLAALDREAEAQNSRRFRALADAWRANAA